MGWVDGAKNNDSSRPQTPKTGGGCCRGMAKVWLIIFNAFFALLGLGIIAIGVLLRFNTEFFESYAIDILTSAEVDGMSLKAILQSVAIVFMLLGFIVTVFAVMGIIGACCSVKMLLTIYGLVMLKIIILEVVFLVLLLVFRSEIDSRIKGALQVTLDTYKGYNSTEPVSIGWNYVFSKFECCGIDSYSDLSTASNWPKTIDYAGSSVTLTSPLFCCKMNGTYPYMTLPTSADCAVTPSGQNSYYKEGCYGKVEEYIMAYRMTLIVICALIMACEVANIITAIIVRQGIVADEEKKKKHKRKLRAWKRSSKNKVSGV